MIDGQRVGAGLLDSPGDAVAMLFAHRIEGLEDHQGQRPLPNVGFRAHIGFPYEYGPTSMGKQ
jgi:hypothetical protein